MFRCHMQHRLAVGRASILEYLELAHLKLEHILIRDIQHVKRQYTNFIAMRELSFKSIFSTDKL